MFYLQIGWVKYAYDFRIYQYKRTLLIWQAFPHTHSHYNPFLDLWLILPNMQIKPALFVHTSYRVGVPPLSTRIPSKSTSSQLFIAHWKTTWTWKHQLNRSEPLYRVQMLLCPLTVKCIGGTKKVYTCWHLKPKRNF